MTAVGGWAVGDVQSRPASGLPNVTAYGVATAPSFLRSVST